MTRRERKQLDARLDLWSMWSESGLAQSPGRTMLAKLIDNKGEIFFGGSAGSDGTAYSVESDIEAAVVAMAAIDPLQADVLRLEYDAGWWEVCARRGISSYRPAGIGQFEKSAALGIGLATYKRRLSAALETVKTHLGVS